MSARGALTVSLVVALSLGLSACGNKESKPTGQALASVDGKEITVMQLNEEMARAGVQADKQEVAKKQLLEAMIDRQLLQNNGAEDKIDRDPKVVQAIERAKAMIIAQAAIQKRIGVIARPSRAEIEEYFNKHPQFFTQRLQFEMRQLIIDSASLTPDVKQAMDEAKSLDDVANWLTVHKVKFARTQIARTSADLGSDMVAKLQSLPKGQLFIVNEGQRSLLIAVSDIKPSPVTLEVAAPQIEQFLMNEKNKKAAAAALAQLRAKAKIEYLNGNAAPGATPATAAPEAARAKSEASSSVNERGVAGLK